MNALTVKLEELNNLRILLAENLSMQGVDAGKNEGFATLIPKVLDILCGDPAAEACRGTTTELDPSYGYFTFHETASLSGTAAVDALSRMDYAVISISGTGMENIMADGSGWEMTTTEDAIYLTHILGENCTRFKLQEYLDAVNINANAYADIAISFFCVGIESGEAYQIGETIHTKFCGTTWEVVASAVTTWKGTEGLTWKQMENIPKPTT